MDTKKVKELVEMARENGLCELKLETKDEKFSIKFPSANTTVVAQAAPVVAAPAPVMAPVGAPASVAPEAPAASSAKQEGLVEVTSPFVGTFYRASSPDADPYVKPGDKVSPGQVLCIVEAMKIMNEIESEASGEIVEVCVENETYVEFGQVLFRVKP